MEVEEEVEEKKLEEDEEEVEDDEEVEEEEESERERMRKNTYEVLCLNNYLKCGLATYVGLTSVEAITFLDTWKINTTLLRPTTPFRKRLLCQWPLDSRFLW